MSKMRNRINRRDFLYKAGLAGAAMAAGPILSACAKAAPEAAPAASDAEPSGPKRTLVWNSPFVAPWELPLVTGYNDFCSALGWEFIHTGASEYSIEIRHREITNSIALNPDVLTTDLNDGPALGPLLVDAMEQGIKVIVAEGGDSKWALDHDLPVYVADAFSQGKRYGKKVCDLVIDHFGKTEGIIAIGDLNPGGMPILDQIRGIELAVQTYNEEKGTNFTTDVFPDAALEGVAPQYAKVESTYEKNRDTLVALVGTGIFDGQLLWQKDQGFVGENRPFIAANWDFPELHLNALEEGYLDFLIQANLYGLGWGPAAQAWMWVERGFLPDNVLQPGELISTAEDIARITERDEIWKEAARDYGLAV
jgi:ABC-type sugar transport system substrate-binding protein